MRAAKLRTESELRTDDHLTIRRGDRVSWALPYDGAPRAFGRVYRVCTRDYTRAYAVTEDGSGIGRIIPGKFITKECG